MFNVCGVYVLICVVCFLLIYLKDSKFLLLCSSVFLFASRKGIFGLKKKKRNKAEKGLILANKSAQGEVLCLCQLREGWDA